MIENNQTYQTRDGTILKVKTVRESGVHTLTTIDKFGNVIPDKKNSFGHIIYRSDRFCSEEMIRSFKRIKLKQHS